MRNKKLLKRIEDLERLIKKQIDSTMEYSNVYCKECKYPILRLDKLATVLKNGQRVFRYEK